MSILSALFGNYGDDLIRNAATKYGDDVLRASAKTTAKQAILSQSDDIAGMTAKQAAKATAKAGKSTAAQQIAKNEFDDYLTSLGATPTLRKQMANEAYNGVLGKTGMADRFKTLNVDLANVADKSAAGLNAYGGVMNNLYDYMDNAGVGVDLSGLQKTGSKLFTKAQKNRLLQSGLDIDDVLKGTVSANQANDLYKLSRELSLKYKKAGVNNAIDGAIGDQLKTFATQIRDKLDETASTVSKSFGLKQKLVDAANSIDDIEVARALSGMTDDAITASTVRSEMAPYMKMKDFIGLQAPKEKTLNVIGIDTGIANPLPKLSKTAKNTALKAKGALQTENGKNAAIALGAGGLGLLGGLLAGGNNSGNQNMGNMSTLGALTGDSDVVYGGNGMNTQVGGKNATTGALGGNAGDSEDALTIGGYSYDDLENAYVSAIMAGDSGAAGVISDMIGMLDAKTKRQESNKTKSGTAQKQQAAMDILNTLMGNFQAQGPVGGTFTNILNSLTGGNYNYQAANYNEQSRGSLAMIIKALGDSGALAEGDVERAMGLIPQITDSEQKAYDKYQNLMSMLQSAGQGS